MEPLRCWSRFDARDGRPTLYCERDAHHSGDCSSWWGTLVSPQADGWGPADCAEDHGPTGRLSVAHRLRELSWQADLLAFRMGEHSEWTGVLASMAARLLVDTTAASEDHARLREAVVDGERLVGLAGESPHIPFAQTVELLRSAAELLRSYVKPRAMESRR